MVSMGLEDVRVAQAQDEVLGPIMITLQLGEKMPAGLPRGLQKSFLQGQVLCCKVQETDTTERCTQIVIPKSLIQGVLKQLHNQAGHLGIFKTNEKLKSISIGQGMSRTSEHGCKIVFSVSSTIPRYYELRHHSVPYRPAILLRRCPEILWDQCQ